MIFNRRDDYSTMQLVIVDYQNDFVGDGGALDCGADARAIEENILALIGYRKKAGGKIVCTLDSHDADEWEDNIEKNLFPKHCFVGTAGHDIYGRAGPAVREAGAVFLNKRTYGCTSLPGEIDKNESVVLCGVATDICVQNNAALLRAAYPGLTIFVAEDACASYDKKAHEQAIDYMKNILGCVIVKTAAFVSDGR